MLRRRAIVHPSLAHQPPHVRLDRRLFHPKRARYLPVGMTQNQQRQHLKLPLRQLRRGRRSLRLRSARIAPATWQAPCAAPRPIHPAPPRSPCATRLPSPSTSGTLERLPRSPVQSAHRPPRTQDDDSDLGPLPPQPADDLQQPVRRLRVDDDQIQTGQIQSALRLSDTSMNSRPLLRIACNPTMRIASVAAKPSRTREGAAILVMTRLHACPSLHASSSFRPARYNLGSTIPC